MSKVCNKCKQGKSLDEFHRSKSAPDGHIAQCKQCRSEYYAQNADRLNARSQKYRADNAERRRQTLREYHIRNAEQICARSREYYAQHKEILCEKRRVYQVRNQDRLRAKKRAYRSQNAERLRDRQREYNKRYPERIKEARRKWKQAHPEQVRAGVNARRARIRGASGTHTQTEWLEVVWRQQFCCAYCGTYKPLTRDHIVPLSKGGSDNIENIQGLCLSCNSSKGTKLPEEWEQSE
jgi:5-methylcytosine-specific restriction endonuclease McrA